jgi:hydrogenase expression/formation protein HypC
LLDDAGVGDYVIVHAGFAIHKIDEEAALETLKLLREAADYVDSLPKEEGDS